MGWSLTARTVLITGAGNGIGRATAESLVGRGAHVALLDIDADGLNATAANLGPSARAWPCDVTDSAALIDTAAGVAEHFGGIDVVLANAGVFVSGGLEDADAAVMERALEVNLLGVWRTLRATLPYVLERRGYVLAVSSLAAAVHLPLASTYSASKAGVEALADSLRPEVAGRGVDVGVAYFGHIDTDMARPMRSDPVVSALLRLAPGRASRAVPVEQAAAALVRGMERRSTRICEPAHLLPIILAPGLLEPLYLPLLRKAMTRRSGREHAPA